MISDNAWSCVKLTSIEFSLGIDHIDMLAAHMADLSLQLLEIPMISHSSKAQ